MYGTLRPRRKPIDTRCPINWDHPLSVGLVCFFKSISGRNSSTWFDLVRGYPAALNSMANTSNGFKAPQAPGGDGGGLLCDGSAGYVSATLPITFGYPVTINCWFRPNSSSSAYGLVSLSAGGAAGGSNPVFQLEQSTGGIAARGTSTGAARTATTTPSGVWGMASAVFASATSRTAYINAGGAVSAAFSDPGPTGASVIWIANANNNTSGSFLAGAIDNVQVWSRVLSQADIESLLFLGPRGFPGLLNRVDGMRYPTATSPPATVPRLLTMGVG